MVERAQNRPPRLSTAEGRHTRGWMQARYGVVEPDGGFNFAGEINRRPEDSPNDSTLSEPFVQSSTGMVADGQVFER